MAEHAALRITVEGASNFERSARRFIRAWERMRDHYRIMMESIGSRRELVMKVTTRKRRKGAR